MSKSEFKFNKKRKHYSYIFKAMNGYCLNILLTTDSESRQKKHKKVIMVKNIQLFRHPNKNSKVKAFIYNHPPYLDNEKSFDKKLLNWSWDKNDKRKVKRMKKYKKCNRNKNSR